MVNTAIEKILGFVLLVIGLSIIGASLYLGINTFIKAQDPPVIFKPLAAVATPSASPSATVQNNINAVNSADLQKMVTSSITPEMIKSIIPPEIFGYTTKMMNLTVFSLFLWVLIIAGAKVASLGVALIKSNADVKF